jgi:hypothetical protein
MTSPFTIAAAGTGKGVGVGEAEGVGLSTGLIATVGKSCGVGVSLGLRLQPARTIATPAKTINDFLMILPLVIIYPLYLDGWFR